MKNQRLIQFSWDNKGESLKLSVEQSWYGGIDGGFVQFDSKGKITRVGNTAPENDLLKYIKHYKKRKIRETMGEIKKLQKRLENLKLNYNIDTTELEKL